ncbi:OmpA family protein [Verrucomicrobiota bacterium]
MKHLVNYVCRFLGIILMILAVASATTVMGQDVAAYEEPAIISPWYGSLSLGVMDFEGDQEFLDGPVMSMRLGYDFSERWGAEGCLHLAPSLKDNDEAGPPAPDWSSTYAMQMAVDFIFHFTRWARFDPYLAAGVGLARYGEEPVGGDQNNSLIRGGGGIMYHFNDEWAVRFDYRAMLTGFGDDPNANAIIDGGVIWTWGARIPMGTEAGNSNDPDNDGLITSYEMEIGTDPYNPDTDNDELKDGLEVKTYDTDPLNPDSDWDLLKDGAEVWKHNTDPTVQDTDNGGVSDGHEILEDDTDPTVGHGDDDLILYTLNIEFDTNKSVIKPQYFADIDVIGKVLSRNPESAALIEGHADKRKKSVKQYNLDLSKRRANAVLNYLSTKWKIGKKRLKAVGHGFERPIAPNDPKSGNRLNRRVDVYIEGVSKEEAADAAGSDMTAADDEYIK